MSLPEQTQAAFTNPHFKPSQEKNRMASYKQYETDVKLMHRIMREELPGFHGSKQEPRSTTQTLNEVHNNISRLKRCDESTKQTLILQYLFSHAFITDYEVWAKIGHPVRKCKTTVIDYIKQTQRSQLEDVADRVIRMTELVTRDEEPEQGFKAMLKYGRETTISVKILKLFLN